MTVEFHPEVRQAIEAQRGSLVEDVVARHYRLKPELAMRYGESGRRKCLQDARYHMDYLADSVALGQPSLFTYYVDWARTMLEGRGIPVADLATNLECMRAALQSALTPPCAELAGEYIETGLQLLQQPFAPAPTFLHAEEHLATLANEYLAALLCGDRAAASRLVLDAVQSGVAVQEIYLQVFQPVQREVGRLWQMHEISVAQEHYCTAITQLIMSQLYPYLFGGEKNGRTLVATCIAGETHEIGVRMVADLFELNGWDTFYLGANTPHAGVLDMVRERRADVVGISTTIVSHLRAAADLIAALRAAPDCAEVKIIVGGYPFNIAPELWRQLGADGYAGDAATAVELANGLVDGIKDSP